MGLIASAPMPTLLPPRRRTLRRRRSRRQPSPIWHLRDINLFNHPGPEQLKHYGYALADIFEASEFAARPTNAPVSFDTLDTVAGTYSTVDQGNTIVKGGPIPATGAADLAITFPVPFPTDCLEVLPNLEPGTIGANVTYTATITGKSRTGFTVQRRGIGSGGPGAATVAGRYIARGY